MGTARPETVELEMMMGTESWVLHDPKRANQHTGYSQTNVYVTQDTEFLIVALLADEC